MSDVVIRAENLGKKYMIGHQAERGGYTALRDVLSQNVRGIWHKTRDLMQGKPIIQGDTLEEVWALQDINFEIRQGEAVGIIGRNGAGKSTLLKILSRITEPSTGRLTIKGRVASLLEVGTGFHPELSGRENIYLNGAILGMTRREITRKFDEIVAFAEVEKYLDTPVKRYSSGMYVRLAFAVAAHLEPEILVVDEVLAAGDAEFQKKCLGKMGDVAGEGRTVIFVSHNMDAITRLCPQVIFLNSGRVFGCGSSNTMVQKYLMVNTHSEANADLARETGISSKKSLFFRKVTITNHLNEISSEIDIRHSFHIHLAYEVVENVRNVELSVRIETYDGIRVMTSHQSDYDPNSMRTREVGIHYLSLEIPKMLLMPDTYFITIYAHEPMSILYDLHERILRFNVNDTGSNLAKYHNYRGMGLVITQCHWTETNEILVC